MAKLNKEQLKTNRLIKMAEVIDTWYFFRWKDKMVGCGVFHKLGFAKEELKRDFEDNIERVVVK